MKIFGRTEKGTESLALKEVVMECSVEEIGRLLSFFEMVKERHDYYADISDECHTHFRDWEKEWETSDPDLIIVTTQESANQ